jgi:hypothetical protein
MNSEASSDPLTQFLKRYASKNLVVPTSVFAGVSFVGDFAQLVLVREGEFQVQLCLCRPNAVIPQHTHPNVEQFLIYVTGEIVIEIDGKAAFDAAQPDPFEKEDGTCSHNGTIVRVAAGQRHGGVVGKTGAAFMTVQRWLNASPETIEKDWDGEALSKEHATDLAMR